MSSVKVKIKQKGFKSEAYLKRINNLFTVETFTKIAEESLNDFIHASPSDEIAHGWEYHITNDSKRFVLSFDNNVIKNGINIAILVDVGHYSIHGNWIPGKNYLKEPIKKTYERIDKLLKEAQ